MENSSQFKQLKITSQTLAPTFFQPLFLVLWVAGLTLFSLWLSFSSSYLLWGIGQLLLAISMLQWFMLLHETGHKTLFKKGMINRRIGHVASLFCGIPFHSWQMIHHQHHKWAGWQDIDPTTEQVVPRKLRSFERNIINFCWKLYLPVFSILYRFNNYWNLPRLFRLFPRKKMKIKHTINMTLLLLSYILASLYLGPVLFLKIFGLSFFLHMIFSDPILLSQHSHIPQHLSSGSKVQPFLPETQDVFTRSIVFPKWISRTILFNFDAHEIHHMFPKVPGYLLPKLNFTGDNQVSWIRWLKESKKIPADVLLFQNRNETGYDF